jgi:hypothetical protein
MLRKGLASVPALEQMWYQEDWHVVQTADVDLGPVGALDLLVGHREAASHARLIFVKNLGTRTQYQKELAS